MRFSPDCIPEILVLPTKYGTNILRESTSCWVLNGTDMEYFAVLCEDAALYCKMYKTETLQISNRMLHPP